jgi:hypothetical protein
MKPETMMIDDVKYVRADKVKETAAQVDGLNLVLVRSYGAGVFYGYLKEKKAELNGINITLIQARRIFYWDGACSLTQIAVDGTTAPDNCKITDPIDNHFIANVIEILPMSRKAALSLEGVKAWKK